MSHRDCICVTGDDSASEDDEVVYPCNTCRKFDDCDCKVRRCTPPIQANRSEQERTEESE
jgi:hypothetical protein